MSQTRAFTVRGTRAQVQAVYKSAQTHNLLAGWWGVFSLFVTTGRADRQRPSADPRQAGSGGPRRPPGLTSYGVVHPDVDPGRP